MITELCWLHSLHEELVSQSSVGPIDCNQCHLSFVPKIGSLFQTAFKTNRSKLAESISDPEALVFYRLLFARKYVTRTSCRDAATFHQPIDPDHVGSNSFKGSIMKLIYQQTHGRSAVYSILHEQLQQQLQLWFISAWNRAQYDTGQCVRINHDDS